MDKKQEQSFTELMEEAGYTAVTDEELRELGTITEAEWILINRQTEKALEELKAENEADALGVF